VSICIPACNEARNIERLIASLFEFNDDLIRDVTVCVNGSTDGTGEIVQACQKRYERLRLLESQPGKAHAWNMLFHSVDNNILAFMDGDVEIDKDSIPRLVAALADDGVVIAGARLIMQRSHRSLSQAFIVAIGTPFYQEFLSGGLYAVRKKSLLDRLKSLHFEGMPPLTGDDFFLQAILHPSELKIVREAAVYHKVTLSIDQYLYAKARLAFQEEEARRLFPALYAQYKRNWQGRGLLSDFLFKNKRLEEKSVGLYVAAVMRLAFKLWNRGKIAQRKKEMLENRASPWQRHG